MNKITERFLAHQLEEARRIAAQSDVIELFPESAPVPSAYLAHFKCRGLIRAASGAIEEASSFQIGIRFDDSYLRRVSLPRLITWFQPREVFHPNISPPLVCLGSLRPGTPLQDLLLQLLEIITWQKVTMREDDALNREACVWARQNLERFPLERPPLKRRTMKPRFTTSQPSGGK